MILKDKYVLLGSVLAGLLLGVLAFSDPSKSSLLQRKVNRNPNQLSQGTLAPEFRLPTAQGEILSLEQLKGTTAVIVFVTATCPYCKTLKEELLDQGLPDLGNRLVFVSQGNGDLQKYSPEIQQLESRFATLIPVLQDSTGKVFEAYKVLGVPTAYQLDEKGKVNVSGIGVPNSLELVQRLVEEVLSSQKRARL